MRALDTDESGVTWTLTGYLVAAAVFTPLMGRLVVFGMVMSAGIGLAFAANRT